MRRLAFATQAAIAIIFSGTGGALGAEDPAVEICEAVLKAQLKAPKSYERVSASIKGSRVIIVYDAVNEFNAPLRNSKTCAYAMDPTGKLSFTSARAQDGTAAMEALRAEIEQAKSRNITEQEKQDFQRRIDEAIAYATSETTTVFADILIANELTGFPIDPSTTAIKPK